MPFHWPDVSSLSFDALPLLERLTCRWEVIVLCPGNSAQDDPIHHFLVEQAFDWGRYKEPRGGWKRKYRKGR